MINFGEVSVIQALQALNVVNDGRLRLLLWVVLCILRSECQVLLSLGCLWWCHSLPLKPCWRDFILLVLHLARAERLLFFDGLLRLHWPCSDTLELLLVPSNILVKCLNILDQSLLFILLEDCLCEILNQLLLVSKCWVYLMFLNILICIGLIYHFRLHLLNISLGSCHELINLGLLFLQGYQ